MAQLGFRRHPRAARPTLVRMFFSVGVPEGLVEGVVTLVSAGFSWRGLQDTVTEPMLTIASALSSRAGLRIF